VRSKAGMSQLNLPYGTNKYKVENIIILISDFHISQDSVATSLRRGGIFKYDLVANFLPSQSLKKVAKIG